MPNTYSTTRVVRSLGAALSLALLAGGCAEFDLRNTNAPTV